MIERRIVPSVAPSDESPAKIARQFRSRVASGEIALTAVGEARDAPEALLSGRYAPRYEIRLFDTIYLLSDVAENENLRFFVGYVVKRSRAWARLFYKDVSLTWRSASHWVSNEEETWIGKGDLAWSKVNGELQPFSNEATTDLPLEIQTAVESLVLRAKRIRYDTTGPGLVLRNGGPNRVSPFSDFSNPRRRAQADPANRINGGRHVAWFTRKNDPASLRFARGYAPDFERGIIERAESRSKVYGGRLRRFRILSENRQIQYQFMSGRWHNWILPPQALTTQVSPYGVRTVDVAFDDDLCVPGWEFHYYDDSEDPPILVSQIPKGFAGRPNTSDSSRSDTSAWLNGLPVVQEFKRKVLHRKSPAPG